MIEVRNDDLGKLDEVVGQNVGVHLERMDTNWFYLCVEDGERRIILNIGAPSRRKVNATIYEDVKP